MTTSQYTRQAGGLWRAARRAAAALRHIHNEQTVMWELRWQASRAAVPETGPLTWVPTLDGKRLAGSHLPVPDETRAGGTS
jgi:hypothetical protein